MKKNLLGNSPLKATKNDALEQQALSQFRAGRYKEAGDLYKELLKSADNGQWRQQLAQCYLLRARALAGKGMLKEAIILWENYAEQIPAPLENQDHYLLWLLATKNTAKIKTCLGRLSAEDLDERYPGLAALLGLHSITVHPEFQALLPQESAFMMHLGQVLEALAAYRENQPDKLDAALKKLPFRSAFRDFRSLIKALVLLPDSAGQAHGLLTKIAAESPYHPTAQALLAYMSDGEAFIPLILQLNHNQRKIVVQAKGFNKKQTELLETLHKQNDRLSDKLKFNLAIQYQSLFGAEAAQGFCYATLASYPAGRKDYVKHFGAINDFDENRLKALQSEQDNNSHDAEYYWRQCLEFLKINEPGNVDKIALIQRHIAKKAEPEDAVLLLIDSLEYDPGDRESYLKILKYYDQHEPDPSEHKHWLEKSLKQFPQDVDFLIFAIKSARRSKAFKKAAQYAEALLKIDPLNTLAKQLLFSSHLAHARRLIKTKKFHLVDKEIQAAEKLSLHKRFQMQAQLMRGFFQFLSEDKKQGLAVITQALQKLNADPVNAHFQAAMEALLLDLPVAAFLKGLPAIKDQLLSEQGLTHLLHLVKHYNEQDIDRKTLHKALEKIKPVIKKSVQQQDYSEDLSLSLCQTLDDIEHFELLRHCAKLAQAKWQKPIWLYYQVYSEANGDPDKFNSMSLMRLQLSLDQARKENDQRTAFLIGRFIERYYETHRPFGMGGIFDDAFDLDEDDGTEEMVEDLFVHLPEAVVRKIAERLAVIMQKSSPERLLQDIIKFLPKNINPMKIMSLLQEPECFTAMAMLKVADDLGIKTGVSVEDIFEYFDMDNGAKPFPFPFF